MQKMSFGKLMTYAMKYGDNAARLSMDIAAYAMHRDESQLAGDLTEELLETAREIVGPDRVADVDEERLIAENVRSLDNATRKSFSFPSGTSMLQ